MGEDSNTVCVLNQIASPPQPYTPDSVNVISFGNRVLTDVTKSRWDHPGAWRVLLQGLVPLGKGGLWTQTHTGEGQAMVEVEVETIHLSAGSTEDVCHKRLVSKDSVSPGPSEGAWCWYHDFRLLISRTIRANFCCFKLPNCQYLVMITFIHLLSSEVHTICTILHHQQAHRVQPESSD